MTTTNTYETCSFQLYGHTGNIHCLTDVGGIVCSGSADHTIRAWDVQNTVCKRVLMGHEALVSCMQSLDPYKPHLLLSGSHDDQIRIWNIEQTGHNACVHHISNAHNSKINSIDIIDENMFVSASADMTVKQWDIRQLRCAVSTLSESQLSSDIFSSFNMGAHSSSSSRSSDGYRSGSNYVHNIGLYSGDNSACRNSLTSSYGEVFTVRYGTCKVNSDEKQVLFVGCRNGVLLALDLHTGEVLRQYHGHYGDVVSCVPIQHSDQNHQLLSASKDNTVRLFDIHAGGDPVHTFDTLHSSDVTCLQFCHNPSTGTSVFYSGSTDGTVKEVDLHTKQITRVFERLVLQILAIHKNEKDGILYVGADEEVVRAWKVD